MNRNENIDTMRRYVPISVPGRENDGSDTCYFVFDTFAFRTAKQAATREEAQAEARRMNG